MKGIDRMGLIINHYFEVIFVFIGELGLSVHMRTIISRKNL